MASPRAPWAAMKAAWIAVVVALLVGGTWFLLDDRGSSSSKEGAGETPRSRSSGERSRAASIDDAPVDATLETRVARLEREVESLRRQVAIAQGAATMYSRRGDDDDGDDGPRPLATTEFDEAVRAVVQSERDRERDEQSEQRRDRWEARSEERLDDLVTQAGLEPSQRESIAGLWSTERDKAGPIMMAAREGERDFAEAREEIEALRKATDAEVAKLLSAEQFATYEELRPRGPGGRGGGGRRDGRERDR